MIKNKKYHGTQVGFAPGIYCGLAMASAFTHLLTESLFLTGSMLCVIAITFYNDAPLRYLLALHKVVYSAFAFFMFITIVISTTLVLYIETNLSQLIGMLLIPVGAVSVFILILQFYTHERLEKNGWINLDENQD